MSSQGELLPFAREVIDVPVSEELGESFLAYSLSVITSRAIPDVRDGLKPVQRRILFAMREMRLFPDRPHRKCAGVVGEVMGKFHPHGDSAIYDTLVRMGQDFARSITLIHPQGNFGSLDDPPAAMRYTEARLSDAALHLLAEIDEETVEFRPTYDGENVEPQYLPALLPNLLVNGTTGIAVGMATNMAPHNLGEIFEAIKLVMSQRRPKPTLEQLRALVPGPDFPSGGTMIDDGINDAYEHGRGSVRLRATAEIVDITRARKGIVITELPYMIGVERVMAKVKELVIAGKVSGISDMKNLSDHNSGLRLVIECKTGVDPAVLLQKLYRLTPLEETFGINNVVLVEGVPTTLGLYDLCQHYINHRLDMVVKRSEYRLRQRQERLHKVEGYLIAIDNIDLVVSIIRNAANSEAARTGLMEALSLSEVQAEAILELRLRRLTALAYTDLVEERTLLLEEIDDLEKILASEQRRRTIVIRELGELVKEYPTPRRTRIISPDEIKTLNESAPEIDPEIADEPCLISLSASGVVGREPLGTSRSYTPGRHDVIDTVAVGSLSTDVLAITDKGRLLRRRALDLAEVGGRSRGRDASESFGAERGENILALLSATAEPGHDTPSTEQLFIATATGAAKRIERSVLADVGDGKPIMKLADRDTVVSAKLINPALDVVFVTSDAQALRTPAEGISVQGAGAKGVAGVGVKGNAKVLAAGPVTGDTVIITVTDLGTVKSTDAAEVPSKGRGAGGVRITKFKDESRIDFAWIGNPERIVALVGQVDAPTKQDNTPEPVAIRPTRRDGPSSSTPRRILAIGSLRW